MTLPADAADPPLPDVTMILTGTLAPSSDGKLTPADGDIVSIVNVGTNKEEGTATYSSGGYTTSMSKPPSFNSTQLVLRLKHLNQIYRLTKGDGSDAIIPFNGSLLPVQSIFNLFATSTVVGTLNTDPGGNGNGNGNGNGGSTTPPPSLIGDVNGDRKVDETDIQILKDAISGKRSLNVSTMDINKDGVVNTRDLIETIRAVRSNARAALRPVSSIAPR